MRLMYLEVSCAAVFGVLQAVFYCVLLSVCTPLHGHATLLIVQRRLEVNYTEHFRGMQELQGSYAQCSEGLQSFLCFQLCVAALEESKIKCKGPKMSIILL